MARKRIPLVQGEPGFEEALLKVFPGYDKTEKDNLQARLEELPSSLDAAAEIEKLEWQARWMIYAKEHFSNKPLTENQRAALIKNATSAAKRLDAIILELAHHRVFPAAKNSQHSNPWIGDFKFDIRDLLDAVRELPISLRAGQSLPIHERRDFTDIGDVAAQGRDLHQIEFIEACMQIWIRNGGTFGISVKEIEDESKDDNTYRIIEGGIIGFTHAAHLSVFQKAGLKSYTHDALRVHWQQNQKDFHKRKLARML